MAGTSVFDFLNSISLTKKNLLEEDHLAIKNYTPFMVNRGLSYYPDTVLYANEMNRFIEIPREWQFSFLLNTITRRKRYSKWFKADAKTKEIELVMEYYGYSTEKARNVVDLLSEEQLLAIEGKLNKGGKK